MGSLVPRPHPVCISLPVKAIHAGVGFGSGTETKSWGIVVSVPDPKPTPAWIAFSIARLFGSAKCLASSRNAGYIYQTIFPRVILEAIYTPDEVWGRD